MKTAKICVFHVFLILLDQCFSSDILKTVLNLIIWVS